MKRVRLMVIIFTVVLLLLMIAGIVILIVNDRLDALDTSYEIIAFTIGMAGMLMSVISQIDGYRQEHELTKMKEEIAEMYRESDQQLKMEKRIDRKLSRVEDDVDKTRKRARK